MFLHIGGHTRRVRTEATNIHETPVNYENESYFVPGLPNSIFNAITVNIL
jgi:hypothetical protein